MASPNTKLHSSTSSSESNSSTTATISISAPNPQASKPAQETRVVGHSHGPIRLLNNADGSLNEYGKLVYAKWDARKAGKEDEVRQLEERLHEMTRPRPPFGPWPRECYEGPVRYVDKDGNVLPDVTRAPWEVERRARNQAAREAQAAVKAAEAAKAATDESQT